MIVLNVHSWQHFSPQGPAELPARRLVPVHGSLLRFLGSAIMTRETTLSRRVRMIREERDADGFLMIADDLGLPEQTWRHYEIGVIIPAGVILRFIQVTDATLTGC